MKKAPHWKSFKAIKPRKSPLKQPAIGLTIKSPSIANSFLITKALRTLPLTSLTMMAPQFSTITTLIKPSKTPNKTKEKMTMTKKTDDTLIQLNHAKAEKHGFYLKIGQPTTIHFLDGKKITGILNAISQYEVFLQVPTKDDDSMEITIFKNAIKYIS
ncbi:hypothetical protein CNR30_13690 [Levilactobacillus brevis]|nr:hypothetical protein CNR30_13690 [Levilactobacillus brevis]